MNDFISNNKSIRLEDLGKATQHCSLCPRMCHMSKILSMANGNPDSKVIFIAEAPGRLGADRTGLPLHGDKTGSNFEKLISAIGWHRDSIFITNAILCNPRDDKGSNSTPTSKEIKACSSYVEMTINLVNPELIVTLGRVALESLNSICKHNLMLSKDVGKLAEWNGFKVFPVYHPAPRALLHRSFAKQTSDYINLSKIINPMTGLKKQKTKNTSYKMNEILSDLIVFITKSVVELSYFKLMKLLYLIDLKSIEQTGQSITGEIYLRHQDGPWLPNIRHHLSMLDGKAINLKFVKGTLIINGKSDFKSELKLSQDVSNHVSVLVMKYSNKSEEEIKRSVYLTEPMKFILRKEKLGEKMYNKPVIYKNNTINKKDENPPLNKA